MSARTQGDPVGLLRGPTGAGMMDVVAPHLAEPPARGDLLVVPDGDRLLVLRIAAAVATGSFAEYSERGADYLAQLARRDSEVPERIRELLLRFRIDVVPLGWLLADGRFEAGVRAIQLFGHPVWRPSRDTLLQLANVGLDPADPSRVRLGRLARGHEVVDVPVDFSIRRLKGRRTFVFARAGYGKSNLVKLLLSRLYASPPDVGLLIVDPEGEYAFPQTSERGQPIPGLVDHPAVAPRVMVFTNRDPHQFPPSVRARIGGRMRLDLAALGAHGFLSAFVSEEKQGQVWANWLRSAPREGWARLVRVLEEEKYGAADADILGALGRRVRADKEGDVSVTAIRNNLVPVLERLHGPVDLVGLTRQHLVRDAGVVVLDVSAMSGLDADAVVRAVLERLFQDRVEAFTQGPGGSRGVLLVMEEAQAVLPAERLDDRNIYVRWVKEGRKYGLGAVLVTQQPGAVSPALVSQGDNFFAMHLLAERDLRTLGQANAHYTPEILGFLRDEPVKGNAYVWSAPDQPYVIPVRVDPYEEGEVGVAGVAPVEEPYAVHLDRAVLRALGEEPRVYLFRVEALRGVDTAGLVAVAEGYLAGALPGASALEEREPGDWSEGPNGPVLRRERLVAVLDRLGLFHDSARGTVHGRANREMLVLREDALRAAWAREGVRPRTPRSEAVRLG